MHFFELLLMLSTLINFQIHLHIETLLLRHFARVLGEHIQKLSLIITPNHKDLLIHKEFQFECPWLPAQQALRAMAAYRTPRDKLACVVRCATSVMNLLALAGQDRGSAAATADDFTPVLVYVIIMVSLMDL